MMHPKSIYKILTQEQWQQLQESESFTGAPIDIQDGYIHFSTETQLAETLAKHFAGQEPLEILEVETAVVQENLKWEVSRNEELFPHLYTTLNLNEVSRHWTIGIRDGKHELPNFG